jgi:hypothetical protein
MKDLMSMIPSIGSADSFEEIKTTSAQRFVRRQSSAFLTDAIERRSDEEICLAIDNFASGSKNEYMRKQYGSLQQTFTYRPERIALHNIMLLRDLTVFTSYRHVASLVITQAIVIGIYLFSKQVHVPARIGELVASILISMRMIIGFIAAGYVIQVIGAWKERRANYARFCGAIRNLIMVSSACLVTQPDATPEHRLVMQQARRKVQRPHRGLPLARAHCGSPDRK